MISPGRCAEARRIFQRLHEGGGPYALATLIRREGSVFRRPGACALFDAGRLLEGGVSAGCLDQEVLALARRVLETGRPDSMEFRLDSGLDALFGYGLSCGGGGRIHMEPLTEVMRKALLHLEGLLASRRPALLERNILEPSAEISVRTEDVAGESTMEDMLGTHDARLDESGALRQGFVPDARLFLFGATSVARSLARLGAEVGLLPVILDWRKTELEKFADVRTEEWKGWDALRHPPDRYDAAVILSHNLERDAGALRGLSAHRPAYAGVLGSRTRIARLLEESGVQDMPLHAPAGLDLGGETPSEIALAILSEILLVMQKGQAAAPSRKGDLS